MDELPKLIANEFKTILFCLAGLYVVDVNTHGFFFAEKTHTAKAFESKQVLGHLKAKLAFLGLAFATYLLWLYPAVLMSFLPR
jgi:hypothetical protein